MFILHRFVPSFLFTSLSLCSPEVMACLVGCLLIPSLSSLCCLICCVCSSLCVFCTLCCRSASILFCRSVRYGFFLSDFDFIVVIPVPSSFSTVVVAVPVDTGIFISFSLVFFYSCVHLFLLYVGVCFKTCLLLCLLYCV